MTLILLVRLLDTYLVVEWRGWGVRVWGGGGHCYQRHFTQLHNNLCTFYREGVESEAF